MERRLVLTAVYAVVALSWTRGGLCLGEEADPELSGKPVSQWLQQLRSDNRGLQVRAARALAEAPEKLRPVIAPKVLPLLKSERENDRFVAALVLGEYGPMARAAVPELLPLLNGTQFERNRAAAAKALGQILKDAEPGDEVDKVAEALAAKFNEDYDKYSDVRREAVCALGMIGPAAKKCIPKLTRGLTDFAPHSQEHRLVRRASAWTCGRMGPLAAEHVDRLIAMMHQEGDWVPESVEALGRIGPVHENVVPNIVDKMEQADFNAQGLGGFTSETGFFARALGALAAFGPKSVKAKDFLVRVVKGDARAPWECRLSAITVLGLIGPAAADCVPVLEQAATFKGWPPTSIEQVKKVAAEAIARIGDKAAADLKH